jgi:tetratricopeptide (TPR) repeat protein
VLEKRLEEARLRSTKLRKQITIGFLITIAVCSFILVSLSSFNFSTPKDVTVTVSKEKKLAEADIEKVRDEFKDILQQYKNELEPRLQAANIERWNQNAWFEINEQEKKAMLNFSNGDYPNALNNIQSLKAKTLAILEESEQIFKENMEKAALFLADDHYDEAKLHVEKAMVVAPQSPEALALQQDIEKLQHILPLLNEAKAARAEHDLQKEYNLLRQVLQISSERTEVTERLNLLGQLIKNKKFDAHISSGFAEIENKQIKKARHHYQEAKKVDPKRKELEVLLGQLLAQEKALRIQQALKQAEQAIRQDNWQQAKANFAKVIKDMPENETAIEGLKRANEILGLQSSLNQYINNPYRLTHSSVLSAAEKTLTQAQHSSSYSFGIKRQTEQLRKLIATFNRLIPVTIMSDNKTYVLVRGIGKVGVISQKTIQLKPGNYTFEGTRNGFKSKLLQVLIPHDQNNYSVRIICDEPI